MVGGAAFVEFEGVVHETGADDFVFVRDVDEVVGNVAGVLAESWIAGAGDLDAFEEAHFAVEFEAEVGGVGRNGGLEGLDEF